MASCNISNVVFTVLRIHVNDEFPKFIFWDDFASNLARAPRGCSRGPVGKDGSLNWSELLGGCSILLS